MEINTQQLEALHHLQEQQTQFPRRNDGQPQGFDAILSQQLGLQAPVADPTLPGVGQNSLYSPIVLENAEAASSTSPDAMIMQAAFAQASDTLDMWDNYAKTLGSGRDGSLRDAYSLLEGIDANIASLRQNGGKNALFDSMLNELEVLSATEKFKFNRGDYLA